jgi:hypothetical protein
MELPSAINPHDPVYISTDPERDMREYPTRAQIMRAPIPAVVDRAMRDQPRKEVAAAVRALLKRLGIKGVSVTTPNYSMAMGIQVRIPDRPEDWQDDLHPHRPGDHTDCWRCQLAKAARVRLELLILAAFPDLDDRSDYSTNYYDAYLSVQSARPSPSRVGRCRFA